MPLPESSELPTPAAKPAIPRRRSELTRQLLEVQIGGDVAALRGAIKTGAQWFYWVAALSLINSIVALSGSHFVFLAGSAVSQIADAFAAHLGFFGVYFSLTIDIVVAVFVCGLGYLHCTGRVRPSSPG